MEAHPPLLSLPPARPAVPDLGTRELQRRVNDLRQIDNVTNWLYIAREYLLLALTVGLTIAFYQYRATWGLAWAWNVPVTFVAMVLIGAQQHRLTTLGHEASHYMLFRNRRLNELASDWLCMFPMWTTTQGYRLQHLAHHQYVNDPERDPDVTQMQASGHRFHFPMRRGQFIWECVIKQFLWLPNLIRYIRIRARYSSTGGGGGPYESKGPHSSLVVAAGLVYLVGLVLCLVGLRTLGNLWLLILAPVGLWLSAVVFFLCLPERFYPRSLLKPDVAARWTMVGRITHPTLVFLMLNWLTYLSNFPWGVYYLLLWVVPIGTTFAFFMLLRQVVQHGNAGRERLTNTRVFHVGRLIQMAVFPLGMDYHLPHHLYPMVPHYRLRALHDLLMQTEPYCREATLVEGYFLPATPPIHPTVLDLMAEPGPESA